MALLKQSFKAQLSTLLADSMLDHNAAGVFIIIIIISCILFGNSNCRLLLP
jgi:hypothetical protein